MQIWKVKIKFEIPFTFHVGGYPDIWLMSDSCSFMSRLLHRFCWIHGYGFSTQWLSWWMLVLYVCFVPGMASSDALWNVYECFVWNHGIGGIGKGPPLTYLQLLHIALPLVIEGESKLYTCSSMTCLYLANISINPPSESWRSFCLNTTHHNFKIPQHQQLNIKTETIPLFDRWSSVECQIQLPEATRRMIQRRKKCLENLSPSELRKGKKELAAHPWTFCVVQIW